MAGLLGKLTAQEQQELSRLLRDRLVALGRPVPGPQPPPAAGYGTAPRVAEGWANGAMNGRPV